MKLMAENKRARFDYELLDTYEAGIVLSGDEIKSVRLGHLSLVDCYGYIKDGECFLRNSYIKEYSNSNLLFSSNSCTIPPFFFSYLKSKPPSAAYGR